MNAKQIGSINAGIVIDHLPPGVVWKVVEILGLNKKPKVKVSLGDYYRSEKLFGAKSFIKIEGRGVTPYEANLIALVAPKATFNIIKEGMVHEKRDVRLPEVLKGVMACPNLNCISNSEKEKLIPKIYHREGVFSCHYCRQNFYR
ncbi:MAG: aspartate carbamoyltransferase regulatory subunit, partial [Nanoarchaeota archaeon]|nr:aspartate carbamoyltransferase regulatory subunit [Nanoarchaeota archaeon]